MIEDGKGVRTDTILNGDTTLNHERNYRFHPRVIHAAQSSEDWQGATLPPIFQTASHLHPTAENLSQTFAGQ